MNRPLMLLLSGGLLLSQLACSKSDKLDLPAANAAPATESPALRIQRAHAFNIGADHVEQLKARVNGCRITHGMPASEAVVIPPLDKLRVTEVEELFDGERHAVYRTNTFLAPDPGQGCALIGYVERSVDIETSCGAKLRGTTTPTIELVDERARKPFAVTLEKDEPVGGDCAKRVPPQSTSGAPVEVLPGGASCVWNSAIAARQLDDKASVPAGPTPDAFDVCVHARWPVHAYSDASGQPLSIVLRSHAPRSMPGIQAQGLSADVAAEDLVSYAEGAIPASRFTRGDAEAFLNQPYKRALGTGKP